MFNKKIIIIIILAVIIFFASAVLVFFLAKRAGNKATADKDNLTAIGELKNNHPEFSVAQLKFYSDAAAKANIEPCLGRADERDCVSSVAFIVGDLNFCHDVSYKNEKLYSACIAGAANKIASVKISQCEPLSGDDYYYCLGLIFDINNAPLDCAVLPDLEMRVVCQDFFNYQTAYAKYDRELCKIIKTEKLNQYCLKVIIDKNQDTDGDGLTDLDEINKYKTHYLFADTDNDGIKDGEAVRRGLIKAK